MTTVVRLVWELNLEIAERFVAQPGSQGRVTALGQVIFKQAVGTGFRHQTFCPKHLCSDLGVLTLVGSAASPRPQCPDTLGPFGF